MVWFLKLFFITKMIQNQFFSKFWITKQTLKSNLTLWIILCVFSNCCFCRCENRENIFSLHDSFECVFSIEFSPRFWIKKQIHIDVMEFFYLSSQIVFSLVKSQTYTEKTHFIFMNNLNVCFLLSFAPGFECRIIKQSLNLFWLQEPKNWNPSIFRSKVWLIGIEIWVN